MIFMGGGGGDWGKINLFLIIWKKEQVYLLPVVHKKLYFLVLNHVNLSMLRIEISSKVHVVISLADTFMISACPEMLSD